MERQLAFIFPGQGSQSVGMLAELGETHKSVKRTFEEASDVLGYDLWKLCQHNTDEKLHQTEYTQPALLTASVAIWRVWGEETDRRPSLLAGHSLGEYTALVCAEAIPFAEGVNLVAKRGEFMQAAVPAGMGSMAAIIGLDDAAVAQVCTEVSGNDILAPANFNCPGQVVIAGTHDAVQRACEAMKQAGAKRAITLPVSVPSHCELMRPATEHLQVFIEQLHINPPKIPVIHNVDVKQHDDADSIRQVLIRQLVCPVHWAETIQTMRSQGIETIVECGPDKILWGLNRRIDRSINNKSMYNPATLMDALSVEV